MTLIRQGDLLFVPIENIPPGALIRKSGIIQEGEVTGHHHRVATVEDAHVYTTEDWDGFHAFVETLERPAEIVHEEHGTVTLPAGSKFAVHIAREYDYLGQVDRQVRD